MYPFEITELPISLDLETAGLGPNAPIAAIGAVRFVKNPGHHVLTGNQEFHVSIDLTKQTPVDTSTFYWWLKQSDEARQAILDGEGGVSLPNALRALWQWLQGDTAIVGRESNFTGEVWIRGDRDSVWLEEAHKREGIALPYRYHMVRDQRTLVDFAEQRGVVMPHRTSIVHDALEDARYQAQCLQAVFQRWPEA